MFGFLRVGAAAVPCEVASPMANAKGIVEFYNENCGGLDAVVFPELSISSKNCCDLFFHSKLLEACLEALKYIEENTKGIIIVGLPLRHRHRLLNCAAVICNGELAGFVPKFALAKTERRWFSDPEQEMDFIELFGRQFPIGRLKFTFEGCSFSVEIGEDLHSMSPSSGCLAGAEIIFNPYGAPMVADSERRLCHALSDHTRRHCLAYVLSGCHISESTNEAVYCGKQTIYENGELLAESTGFKKEGNVAFVEVDFELLRNLRLRAAQEAFIVADVREVKLAYKIKYKPSLRRKISTTPFIPKDIQDKNSYFKQLLDLQMIGLFKKLKHIGMQKSVIGVSGGLDSTLALICLARCYDFMGIARDQILAVTMPGFGTGTRTFKNAGLLMKALGVTNREISIKAACEAHLKEIGYKDDGNVVFENAQARERTQILMDLANLENALVIGTGDMSEACLGFCTYNGDQMSMYNVNGGIPKTMIAPLLKYAAEHEFPDAAEAINDICETPISPELLAAEELSQKTEEIVGEYELNDFFMYHALSHGFSDEKLCYLAMFAFGDKYSNEKIEKASKAFFKRFLAAQFKRQASPDAPQIFDLTLSPRNGLVMSCDAVNKLWM